MAIQQGLTNSFKQEMLSGAQNLPFDTLYIALFTALADLGPQTTIYTPTNEVVGDGYVAGGSTLSGVTINTQTTGPNAGTVYVNFDDISWPGANFVARGALIYNWTMGFASIAVLDFGSDKVFTSTNNTVTMPANTATTALIRFP